MHLALLLAWVGRADAEVPAPAEPAPPAPAAEPAAAAPSIDGGVVVDRVAAVVNEEIVTLSEVYAFGGSYIEEVVRARGADARLDAEGEVLDRLLERRLISQEMTALKLDLADSDVDRSIADIAERNGLDTEGLRKEIERSGMPWDQYRRELEENLRDMKFAQTVLRPRVNITEDELRDAWLRSSGAAPAAARLEAFVLPLPPNATEADREAAVAKARELREQAKGDLAGLEAVHPEGKFAELGTFKPGEVVEVLDNVIINGVVGEISEPIVFDDRVFLLRVAERISGANDFESRRDEVAEQVFQARLEDEKQRWFQEAKRRSSIRVLLPGVRLSGAAVTPAR